MTIEEKAKAYDEALEKAKIEISTKGIGETVNLCEQLFPELRESEDERIRKELKEAFEAYDIESTWNGIPIRSIFAWLEKQAKSERVIKAARRVLNNWLDDTGYSDVSGGYTELEYAIREYDGEEKQQEQKPVPFSCGHENDFMSKEWSKEDEAIVGCIACCLDGSFVPEAARKQCLEWFNKHRRDFLNRPSWKPSEEQIEALKNSAYGTYQNGDGPALRELYQQLKKLM